MQIEIITTKRKITKSIINQMPNATRESVLYGRAIGHVILTPNRTFFAIVTNNSEYFRLSEG